MIVTLLLGSLSQAQIAAEARAAFPRECCGLLEGVREGSVARVIAIHPARNLAERDDRFEIDPAMHIGLLRRLRETGREIIGCYHSHPNGRALPSQRDLEAMFDQEFLWLIAAVPPWEASGQKVTFGAFLIGYEGQREVSVWAEDSDTGAL